MAEGQLVPEWQHDILVKIAREFGLTKGHVSHAIRVASNHTTKTTRLEASLAYLLLYLRCSGGPRYRATPMKLFEDRSIQVASAEWQGSSAFTERVFRRRIGRFYTEFRRLGVCPAYFPPTAKDLLEHVDLTRLRLPGQERVRKKAISLVRSSSKELIGRGHQPPTLAGGALYLASRILGEKDKKFRLTLAQAGDLFGTNKESVADASHHVASILELKKFRGSGYNWW